MKILSQTPIIAFAVTIIFITACKKDISSFNSDSYNKESVASSPAPASDQLIVSTSSESKPAINPIKEINADVKESKSSNLEFADFTTKNKSVKKELKQSKKQLKREIKELSSTSDKNDTGISTVLLVIIAILLPPLAVALVDGITGPFWLSILLTLLFYLPGLIYALFRIFR